MDPLVVMIIENLVHDKSTSSSDLSCVSLLLRTLTVCHLARGEMMLQVVTPFD